MRPVARDERPEVLTGHLEPELGQKPVRVPRAHGHLSIVPSIDDIDSPSIRSAVQGDCWRPHRSDLLVVLHRVLLHTGVTSHAAAAPVAWQKWCGRQSIPPAPRPPGPPSSRRAAVSGEPRRPYRPRARRYRPAGSPP